MTGTSAPARARGNGVPVRLERVRSLVAPFAPRRTCPRFVQATRSAGIMLRPTQHEAWFVPAAHTDDDLDATLRAARDAFVVADTER
jgi:glutamate-1-semialdehyde aminotransferase